MCTLGKFYQLDTLSPIIHDQVRRVERFWKILH